jgi:hypothetical protein
MPRPWSETSGFPLRWSRFGSYLSAMGAPEVTRVYNSLLSGLRMGRAVREIGAGCEQAGPGPVTINIWR